MKLLAGGKNLDTTLARLIRDYENIEFAVAWAGTGTKTYSALLASQSKIHRAVIGTHYYQTHPDVLDAFIGSDKVRFVPNTNELFHPKAYFFWNSGGWELIIGSANMTLGGLINNHELVLHVKSEDTLGEIKDTFQAQLQIYWEKANTITAEDAEGYRRMCQIRVSLRNKLAGRYRSISSKNSRRRRNSKTGKPAIRTKTMSMGWEEFLNTVQNDTNHSFDIRCRILNQIRDSFNRTPRFYDMDKAHRKLVAGLPTDLDTDWGYFGSMVGAGYFHQAINKNNPYLSEALAQIPPVEPVSRERYIAYIIKYRKAFPRGGDGVATASRLLAMKRPDFFLCLDSRNMNNLCADFGIDKIGFKEYHRYWDEVMCRIMDSVWWNATEPDRNPGRQIWRARAAMLDAIFYEH